MKKIIGVFIIVVGVVSYLNAQEEKRGWIFSLPGYNMGTNYSYYQPSLTSFLNEQIKSLGMDPVANRRTIWHQGFIIRYSITPDIQIGLHYNTQFDQWTKSTTGDSYALITNVSLTSHLPTGVLVFRKENWKRIFFHWRWNRILHSKLQG